MIKRANRDNKKIWSEISILILIAVLILLQIVKEIHFLRTIHEESGTYQGTVVWRATSSCWMTHRSFYLKIPDCEALAEGSVLELTGSLDLQTDNRFFSQKRMIVKGYTVLEPPVSSPLYWQAFFVRWASTVKTWLVTPLRQTIAYPEEALVESFVLGSGVVLPEAIEHSIKVIGIAHVIAVSGSHLTLLIGILFLVVKTNNRLLNTSIILISLLIYVTVVGWQPAVTRALLMCFILIVGKTILRHQVSFARSLIVSSILMMLYNPWIIFNIGWQLSVLATAGICWIYPVLSNLSLREKKSVVLPQPWLQQKFSRVINLSFEATLASIAVALLIWPVLVENFGVWSWGSILSSVFLWWLFPLVISSCFVGVIVIRLLALVSVHPALLQIPSSLLLEFPVRSVTWLFEHTSFLEWMLIETGDWSKTAYMSSYLAVLALLVLENRRARSRVRSRADLLGPL